MNSRPSKRRTSPAVVDALESRRHLSRNQTVGYLTNYSLQYGGIDLNKIDFSALSQVNYFAAIPAHDGTIALDAAEQGRLDAVVAKAHAHGVTVSLALGGAGQDGSLKAIIGAQPGGNTAAHDTLVAALETLQTRHGLDGIDFDWEPLDTSMTEIANYGLLLQKVQAQTDELQISAAVNAERLWNVAGSAAANGREYVLNDVAIRALDQIGVMAYDLETADHASWDRTTLDLNNWAAEVERVGEQRDMLLFGVPFYGRGGASWSNPVPSYKNLINNRLAQNPGTNVSPAADSLWVAFPNEYPGFNNGQGIEWFFNGPDTIRAKTDHANATAQVGGVMIWDLAQDHTDAQLDYTGYSLLPQIRAATNARGQLDAAMTYDPSAARQTIRTVVSAGAPDAASIGPADLQLTNLTTGQRIDPAIVNVNVSGAAVNWTFDATLPDGNYRATLRGGSIRTAAGDLLAADRSLDFFVLAGDADRDRAVGFADLVTLAQNYNGTGRRFDQGDFNYDGTVGFADLVILAQNYNRSLAAPNAARGPNAAPAASPFAGATPIMTVGSKALPDERSSTGKRAALDVIA